MQRAREEKEENEVVVVPEKRKSTLVRNTEQCGDELLELAGLSDAPEGDGGTWLWEDEEFFGEDEMEEEEEEEDEGHQEEVEMRLPFPWERASPDHQEEEEEAPSAASDSESDLEEYSPTKQQQPSKKLAASQKAPSKKKKTVQYETSEGTTGPARHDSVNSHSDDAAPKKRRSRRQRVLPVWGALTLSYNPTFGKEPTFEVRFLLHMIVNLADGERMIGSHPILICHTIPSTRASWKPRRTH